MFDPLIINAAKLGFPWAINTLLDQAEDGDQDAIEALSSPEIKLDQTQKERFSKLEAKRDQAKLTNGLSGDPEPVGDTFVTSFLQNQKPNYSPETMAIARGEIPKTTSHSNIKTKPLSDIGILDPKPAKSPAEEEAELCRESAIEGIVLAYNTAIDMLKNSIGKYDIVGRIGNAIANVIGNISGLPMGRDNEIRELEQKKQTAIKELNACIEDKPKFDQKFFELTGVRYNERNIKNFCEAVSQGKNDWTTAYDKAFGTPVDIKSLSKWLKLEKITSIVGDAGLAVPAALALAEASPAITALGGAAVIASCNEETDFIYDPPDIYINNTVNLGIKTKDDVETNYKDELNDIINLLTKLVEYNISQGDQIDNLTALVDALITATNENTKLVLEAIIDLGQQQGLQLTQIIEALGKINQTNENIYQAVIDNTNTTAEIKEALTKILDKLDDMNDSQKDILNKIYAAICSGNESNKAQNEVILQMLEILQNIAEKQTEQNEISTETNKMLEYIAGKLNSMLETQAEYYAKILSALTDLSGKLDDLSTEQTALLKKIYTAIENGNAANEENSAMLAAILGKLDELEDNHAKALEDILEAINKNTDIAKGTQELVTEILDKLDTLGGKADDILDKLDKITTRNYDLSTIEGLLNDLLEATKSNNSVLNDINSKMDVVTVSIKAIMGKMDDKSSYLYEMLQKIYDKIPEGCNCTQVDLTVVIGLLEKIVENIENGTTDQSSNEGIIGQLEGLFG